MILATLLADGDLPLNWKWSLIVFVGLIGILVVVYFLFGVVIQWKKLFGRKPPIEDELGRLERKLHGQILETYSRAYKNSEEAKQEAKDVRTEMEDRFKTLNEERQESLKGINQAFRDIERGLGRLEGKTE